MHFHSIINLFSHPHPNQKVCLLSNFERYLFKTIFRLPDRWLQLVELSSAYLLFPQLTRFGTLLIRTDTVDNEFYQLLF